MANDHRTVPPPETRRGNRAGQRKTVGKMLADGEVPPRAAAARAAAPTVSSNMRETALLAAASSWSGISSTKKDRDDDVLASAQRYLEWLQSE